MNKFVRSMCSAIVAASSLSLLAIGCAGSTDDPASEETTGTVTDALTQSYGNTYPTCVKPDVARTNALAQCGAKKLINLAGDPSRGSCRFQTATTNVVGYRAWTYQCQ